MASEQSPSQRNNEVNISGSSVSKLQIAQGDGNFQQSQSIGTGAPAEELEPAQVIALLEKLTELLESSDIPDEQKKSAIRNIEAAKDVAHEEEPDKSFGASALQRLMKLVKSAEETLDAGTSFASKAKPILVQLLPWFGIALGL